MKCLVISLLLLAGCLIYGYRVILPPGHAAVLPPSGYPLTLVDSYQRQVTLDQPPQRVISVAPNITEIIFALGKGTSLVGRTDYCDYPTASRRVASIGNITNPNIEKIVQLQPDLVIASTHFQLAVLEKLEELGIKVVVFNEPESFAGIYTIIRQVGIALNAREQAAQLVAAMQQKVKRVRETVKSAARPKVYYVVGFGKAGDFTAGKDTFIAKLIAMAGGINVANDTKGWHYSLEKLVQKNPDYIICSRYFNTKTGIAAAVGYRDLSAVKGGRLYEIDNNLLDRPGPRSAEGLETLARLLHPKLFSNFNEEQK
ncbi:MAG TPA: ABC transporter substrate-binding protein [Bacillota bacterium]